MPGRDSRIGLENLHVRRLRARDVADASLIEGALLNSGNIVAVMPIMPRHCWTIYNAKTDYGRWMTAAGSALRGVMHISSS
jgi:hypothetical protein